LRGDWRGCFERSQNVAKLWDFDVEASNARGLGETNIESHEAMATFGAKREVKGVGGGELQRRVAPEHGGPRPRGGGVRQTLRAIPGEGVEIKEGAAFAASASSNPARTRR
jgi:hypothetical protein